MIAYDLARGRPPPRLADGSVVRARGSIAYRAGPSDACLGSDAPAWAVRPFNSQPDGCPLTTSPKVVGGCRRFWLACVCLGSTCANQTPDITPPVLTPEAWDESPLTLTVILIFLCRSVGIHS